MFLGFGSTWIVVAAAALMVCGAWIMLRPVTTDRLEHVGTFEWEAETINGLSGLEVSDDGLVFHAVTDRGWYLSGRFERVDGRIARILLDMLLPILGNDGLPVAARRVGDWSDAEGLAMAPDGTYWISFERWAHVSHYTAPDMAGQWIEDHPSFRDYDDNRQLEALALHPGGSLYAFPEQPLRPGFPIYRLTPGGWSIDGHIAPDDGFAITGADFAADGRLYLLERRLFLGFWWQNRVRRLRIETPREVETLWTGRPGEYNNLEGLAVWPAQDGLRLTMVSDNNRKRGEATQFVEFRLAPEPGGGRSDDMARN